MTLKNDTMRDLLLEALSSGPEITAKKMFGAYGFYSGPDAFFAIVSSGILYLRTSLETREKFIAHGMKPFQATEKVTLKDYYEVPVDILDDEPSLRTWANEAIAVAKTVPSKKTKTTPTQKRNFLATVRKVETSKRK